MVKRSMTIKREYTACTTMPLLWVKLYIIRVAKRANSPKGPTNMIRYSIKLPVVIGIMYTSFLIKTTSLVHITINCGVVKELTLIYPLFSKNRIKNIKFLFKNQKQPTAF